jgi:hypothetical protein
MSEDFPAPTPVPDSPVSEVISGADPEAPYGRFKNGKPRKNPVGGGPSAPRSKRQYQSKTKTDYRPGFLGITQIIAFGASFVSPLDAVAVQDHAPRLADAVQVTADNDPRFAAAMDRILSAGPYAALFAAAMPLVVQIMHNHDLVPAEVIKGMGGRSKEEIIESLTTAA